LIYFNHGQITFHNGFEYLASEITGGTVKTETKKCKTCENELPLNLFWRSKMTPDGKWANCSRCVKRNIRKQKWEDNERFLRVTLRDKLERRRRGQLMGKQNCVCAICGADDFGSKYEFCFDRSDKGELRLICHKCRNLRAAQKRMSNKNRA